MKSRLLAAALAALPLAATAAPPDTEVVEFYNTATNHYFVTASVADVSVIESGGAGAGWVRTGRSFSAWLDDAKAAAGSATVYRFYSAGANSHFYTAREDEIALLRQLEAQERRAAQATGAPLLGWQFEGKAFRVELPENGACPSGTSPIRRVYNNGVFTGEGSNHRFVDSAALAALMASRDWIEEGIAFCAQVKSSGTNALLAATTTNFEAVTGDWTGMGRWKTENGRDERRVPGTLQLSISAEGGVTGSGRGCEFTGQLVEGDGFRSLYSGTLEAAGCDDPAFDGPYDRFHVERFSQATLAIHLKRGEGADEASVEAIASLRTPPVTPPGTPPGTPGTPGVGVTGTFAGSAFAATLEVRSRVAGGGVTRTTTREMGAATFTIAEGRQVSGSGFGCAFRGDLNHTGEPAQALMGTITASGCANPLLDGTYDAKALPRNAGDLEFQLEREFTQGDGSTVKATIRGVATKD